MVLLALPNTSPKPSASEALDLILGPESKVLLFD